jgi:hypothetical protein
VHAPWATTWRRSATRETGSWHRLELAAYAVCSREQIEARTPTPTVNDFNME